MAYVMRVEQLALEYRDPHPGYSAGNYDYAMGLFSTNSSLDYMISIGALGAPRDRNTDAIILQIPPSKPGEVGRILTRQDAVPWDVPACRLVLTADGFAILDGRCVLKQVAPSK